MTGKRWYGTRWVRYGLFIAMVAVLLPVFWFGFRHWTQPAGSDHRYQHFTVGSRAPDNIITLHYHERRPYYITDSHGVEGICATPARLAFETAGVPFKWEKTPARRQLELIKRNQGRDCILGWFKNPDRETYARFSEPIYQDKPAIALARADNEKVISGLTIDALLSNRDLVLLRKDAYSYGKFVDQKIDEYHPVQEVTTAENQSMMKMIHAGRADYFFIAREEADWLLYVSDFPEKDFKRVVISNMPEGNKRYLLFSFQVDIETVEKINAAIRFVTTDQFNVHRPVNHESTP